MFTHKCSALTHHKFSCQDRCYGDSRSKPAVFAIPEECGRQRLQGVHHRKPLDVEGQLSQGEELMVLNVNSAVYCMHSYRETAHQSNVLSNNLS